MTFIFRTGQEVPNVHVWCKFSDSSPRVIAWIDRISLNSESKWSNWHWRSRSVTYISNTSREYSRMCGADWMILVLICDKLSRGKAEFHRILIQKWPKWPWRSKSMNSIFNIIREYHMMNAWHKFGDSSSNLWRVIVQTRQSLRTGGRTEGRTDRQRQRQ